MKNGKKRYRAINFDLSTEELRNLFGESGRKEAYKKIGAFLESQGFVHRQWSGYISKNKLDMLEVTRLSKNLFKNFPWLTKCANRIDVTNIGKRFDMIKLHNKTERKASEVDVSTDDKEKSESNTISLKELKGDVSSRISSEQNKGATSKDKGKSHDENER